MPLWETGWTSTHTSEVEEGAGCGRHRIFLTSHDIYFCWREMWSKPPQDPPRPSQMPGLACFRHWELGWTSHFLGDGVPSFHDFHMLSGLDAFISSSHLAGKLTLCTHLSLNKGENHLLVLQIPTCTAGTSFPFLMVQCLCLALCDDKMSTSPDSVLTHSYSWPIITPLFFLLSNWEGEGEQEESSKGTSHRHDIWNNVWHAPELGKFSFKSLPQN